MIKIKNIIVAILLVTTASVASFAQFSHCTLSDIEALKKNTVVVAISEDEATNKSIQEIMTNYWSVSKFKIIKRSELFAYLNSNPENYVLTYFNDLDVHNFNMSYASKDLSNGREQGKIQFIGDCLILAKNLTKVSGLRLTDAMINCYIDFEMRIVNERVEFIRQVGTINAILTFPDLQDSQIGGWKIPTINQKECIEKELWVADIDLNKKVDQDTIKAAYQPYKYKVVSKEEIAKAILEKRKDIVYLAREEYKVGVNLFLIHQPADGKVLFFVKGEGRLDAKGFEKIKSNQPYFN